MKCVDCGTEVPNKKEERELKIEFRNPKTIFLNAKVMECPKCKSKYSDNTDLAIFDELDKKIKEAKR